MGSDVVIDWTSVVSALQLSESSAQKQDHLHVWNLAKLVEKIVFYDKAFTTEVPDYKYYSQKMGTGTFDLSKPVYKRFFSEFLGTVPKNVSASVMELHQTELEPTRVFHAPSGLYFHAADIAALPDISERVRLREFQHLHYTAYQTDDARILTSMGRTRLLLDIGNEMKIPYEPVAFRVPIAEALYPGNITPIQMRPYRKFEKDLYSYISQVIGCSPALSLPLVFNIAIRECGKSAPDDILRVAFQLRDDPGVVSLRTMFGEFVNSYGEIDLKKMADVSRGLGSEVEKFRKNIESDHLSNMNLKVKLGWLPLGVSFDIMSWIHRMKDRKIHAALSSLASLTRETFQPLLNVRREIDRVLGVEMTGNVLKLLPPIDLEAT